MTVEIRAATRGDLSAVIAIERASFGDPWTSGMFSVYLSDPAKGFFVATAENSVAGYTITRRVAEESELLNIAVEPASRGRGIGGLLLDACIRRCAAEGAVEMWLEVRASNVSARALYAARGFSEMGVRKRYYEAPREDAILLRATLGPAPTADGNETVIPNGRSLNGASDELILSRASHHPRQETQ